MIDFAKVNRAMKLGNNLREKYNIYMHLRMFGTNLNEDEARYEIQRINELENTDVEFDNLPDMLHFLQDKKLEYKEEYDKALKEAENESNHS